MTKIRWIVACFCLPSLAWAMEPIPGEQQFETMLDQPNRMAADVTVGQIKEDWFLQITPRLELNLGMVGLGLQIPLNLRVWDRDPNNNDDYYGIIRYEDWNDISKFVKLIRYVRLGHKRDTVYLRVGELTADVGHGTIMNRYLNNVDVDTFHVGTQFDVNTKYGGFETVISNVGGFISPDSPDSRVVGGRAYFKPYSLVDADSWLNMFALGATVITDINAPKQTQMEISGTTDEGKLVVTKERQMTGWGFDFEVQVLHSDLLDIVPYTDLNFLSNAGWGWHLGTLVTAKLPVGFELTIPVRLEYRRFREDYVPGYFSTFYEIERFRYPTGGHAIGPKARVVRHLPDDNGINGYYGDLAFNFAGLLQVGAVLEYYDTGDPNLQAILLVPALDFLQFKAYYARVGITSMDDAFVLKDDRSLLVAEARYELVSYVYLVGRITRKWQLESDPGKSTYGTYQSVDSWKFGIETSFTF